MTDTTVADNGGPSMSANEEAFFASGGEAEIPREEGEVTGEGGSTDTNTGGEAKPGDGKPPAGDKQPQNVPLAALHEERGKRKKTEGELREARERLANFEGRFAVLDRLAPKKEADGATEQPAGPPSAQDDIFGAVDHVGKTVAELQKQIADDRAATEASTKAATEQKAFVDTYRADANTFVAKTPDYMDAYNHLLGSRAQELIAIGYDDPVALQNSGADVPTVQAAAKVLHDALVADEYAIADRALKAKKSPAQIIYDLAKQRGYVKKGAAADGKKPGEDKLDQIERGQATNKSLNATGGATGDADITAERLLSMPMDEYTAWVEKNPSKARAIMGG